MKHRILLFVVTIIILLIVSGCSSTTPLIKASTQGNYLSVQKLINEGANINEPDSNGMTPLMHAILCQNVEAIETLIKKGADLSIKDKSGYTALYYAVYNNNYTIVKSLIDNGADVNAQDLSGQQFCIIVPSGSTVIKTLFKSWNIYFLTMLTQRSKIKMVGQYWKTVSIIKTLTWWH